MELQLEGSRADYFLSSGVISGFGGGPAGVGFGSGSWLSLEIVLRCAYPLE